MKERTDYMKTALGTLYADCIASSSKEKGK